MLTRTIAFQGFQSVARRYAQIVQSARLVQLLKLATRYRLDVGKAANPLSIEQGFRVHALERLDHAPIVTIVVINVNRDYMVYP